MKRVLLLLAVLGVAVLVYLNRRLLESQLGLSYRAATGLVTGKQAETNGAAETTNGADKKAVAGKKSSAAGSPAARQSPPNENVADGSAVSSSASGSGLPPAAGSSQNPNTDVMIVGSGSSIGDIQSSNIFGDARVYTTYIEMKHNGAGISEWTMQYALLDNGASSSSSTQPKRNLRSVQMEPPVRAPIPIEKEYPQFPAEIVAQNPGSVVVVYGVINTGGKMEQMRILPSSDPRLNQPVLEALQKWSFQPARVNGSPVAVKSLLGIVLPNAL